MINYDWLKTSTDYGANNFKGRQNKLLENYGKEPPSPDEIIHHKKGDKKDNRLKNLEKLTRSEHNKIHNKNKDRNKLGQFT